jgi:transcriptional regulator with XRE-family HTH domain
MGVDLSLQDLLARSLGACAKNASSRKSRVAQELEVSQSALSAWESGVTLPPRSQVIRIAAVLRVGLEILEPFFGGRGNGGELGATIHWSHPLSGSPTRKQIRSGEFVHLDSRSDQFVGDGKPLRSGGRWRSNLKRGMDYNIIWFLELVPEESFRAAVALFAKIERRAGSEHLATGTFTAAASIGVISHYATSAFEAPGELITTLYHQLEKALDAGTKQGPRHGK